MSALEPSKILVSAYERKKSRNPRYSLRALARDLGVSPTYLNLVIHNKKKLSFERATQLTRLLRMDEEEAQVFLRGVALQSTQSLQVQSFLEELFDSFQEEGRSVKDDSKYLQIEVDRLELLGSWYHLPILDLSTCEGFESRAEWVAEKLGISVSQAEEAIERLLRLGLLVEKKGVWQKSSKKILFSSPHSTAVVRGHHRQMMQKATEVMEDPRQEAFEARSMSSFSLALDPEKLSEAKKLIQNFQEELATLVTKGECRQVYQLNVQFFPLSKITK